MDCEEDDSPPEHSAADSDLLSMTLVHGGLTDLRFTRAARDAKKYTLRAAVTARAESGATASWAALTIDAG
jgi:hypothetical protein